jgi:hypothetical protein
VTVRPGDLLIRLTKHADGESVLQCTRANGSTIWQRHHGRQAAFFPLHDLTHFAIESEVGFRRAFYGLLADGWDFEDTTGKGARGALPPEALAVEHLVGAFDLERAGSVVWTAVELNEQATTFAAERGLPSPRSLTGDELMRVRSRIGELLGRWAALRAGATLELSFTAAKQEMPR